MKRLSVSVFILSLLAALILSPVQSAHAGTPCDDPNSGACLAEIQAHPAPDAEPIAVNRREVGAYSFFRVMPDTDLYDAPNGNIVGRMDNGFSFVIVYEQREGFARLRSGQWVARTSLKQSYASSFSGLALTHPLAYPMAWVIQASIPSSSPGASNDSKTPAISRYTRLYIYATVHVGSWDWYLVGPGQWLEQRKVARVLPVSRPEGSTDKWVSVNLFEQVLTAYEGDRLVFATLISSGLPNFQTNVGTFKVWHRADATPMSGAMGSPAAYSLPAVPYVMFFDDEISLHGTYWHDGFGFKHSHGCVNMSITDAHWIYDWSGAGDLTVNVISGRA